MFPIKLNVRSGEDELIAVHKVIFGARDTFMVVCSALFLGAALYFTAEYYLAYGKVNPYYTVMTVLFAIMLVRFLLMPVSAKKAARKTVEIRGITECGYEFFEDHYTVERRDAQGETRESFKYSELAKVVETEDYIFLMRAGAGSILPKGGLKFDELDALREALKKVLGKKYKIKK